MNTEELPCTQRNGRPELSGSQWTQAGLDAALWNWLPSPQLHLFALIFQAFQLRDLEQFSLRKGNGKQNSEGHHDLPRRKGEMAVTQQNQLHVKSELDKQSHGTRQGPGVGRSCAQEG